MKIAHIKSLYDKIGGIESLIGGLMPELLAIDGVDPVVILIADRRNEEMERLLTAAGKAPLRIIDWRGLKSAPAAGRELAKVLQAEGVDVVHTHDMRSNLLTAIARLKSPLPWLCHMHGWLGSTHSGRYRIYEAIDRKLIKRADHVLVGSYDALDEVRAAGARNASVAWNAVAIPPLRPGDRAQLGLPDEAVIAAVMGRLHYGKGQDLFLKALSRIDPDLNLHGVVVGVGEADAELKALAAELGITERVTFTGFVDAVAPWIEASDIIAVPSRKESLPLTALEAMAAARPVVAAQTGDLPRVIEDGTTGLIFPVDDVAGLAQALESLASDPSLRARMGSAARAIAIANHSVGTLAAETVRVARTLT